jgi:adenylate kinase
MFRRAIEAGTDDGLQAKNYMDSGELVPDEIVIKIVESRLGEEDAVEGFVLDGFPRTAEQAKSLDQVLNDPGLDLVIELEVPTDVVLRRLAARRVCINCGAPYSPEARPKEDWICDICGGKVVQRQDDTEAAIKRRLHLYTQQTEPLVAYYMAQDKLAPVDGTGDLDTVTARLFRGIEKRLSRR